MFLYKFNKICLNKVTCSSEMFPGSTFGKLDGEGSDYTYIIVNESVMFVVFFGNYEKKV